MLLLNLHFFDDLRLKDCVPPHRLRSESWLHIRHQQAMAEVKRCVSIDPLLYSL